MNTTFAGGGSAALMVQPMRALLVTDAAPSLSSHPSHDVPERHVPGSMPVDPDRGPRPPAVPVDPPAPLGDPPVPSGPEFVGVRWLKRTRSGLRSACRLTDAGVTAGHHRAIPALPVLVVPLLVGIPLFNPLRAPVVRGFTA